MSRFIFLRFIVLLTISSEAQDMKLIESEAFKRWPDKPDMQAFTIKTEREAFKKLQNFQTDKVVDKKSLRWLKEMAVEKWPKSYKMQEFLVRSEIKAGHSLANFTRPQGMTKAVFDGVFDRADEKWEQWSMVLYRLKTQTEAWSELKELTRRGGMKAKRAVKEGENKWPDDYTMQLYVANKILEK